MARVHLWLEIDGNSIEGDSPVHSLDREGTIECLSFHYEGTTATDWRHKPIRIHKRIEKSTPYLLEALCRKEGVEATFQFYRPKPGSGEENFFTVVIQRCHITSVKQDSDETTTAGGEPLEEVEFTFKRITWQHEARNDVKDPLP